MEKVPNSYNNTALIDADYIIWIACNANKVLDEKGEPLKKEGKFVYTPKTVEEAISTCDSYLEDILNLTHSDSYILCLTGPKNFRYEIDPEYKANRKGIEKPLWFKEVRDHLINKWKAIKIDGLEADDIVSLIFHNMENTFIIAADKDLLDCIPGRHFDTRKGRVEFVTTTQEQAEFNFAKSMLIGDAIDGISNIMKGYGDKTAKKDIYTLTSSFYLMPPLTAAYGIYISLLGTEGPEKFSKQFRLLKILDNLEDIPEGINFVIPEPVCYDCVEVALIKKYKKEIDDLYNIV